VIPAYHWWEIPFYWIGLKLYDLLAGGLGLGSSCYLSSEQAVKSIPTLNRSGLKGGIRYMDAQFDDARLAISLLQTLIQQGGVAANYLGVEGLIKERGRIKGVVARDAESGYEHEVLGRVVVNATGVFADEIRHMDEPEAASLMSPSQGVHLVLPQSFLKGDNAVIVPRTDDGRVLFALPWHGRVVVGTTDTPVAEVCVEPRPLEEELEFLLSHAGRYLTLKPTRLDVLSVFAGLRPLVNPGSGGKTSAISRDHALFDSPSGLVTITGGKWTTYRAMAEDTVNRAVEVAGLRPRPCVTRDLHLHGWASPKDDFGDWQVFGSDASRLETLAAQNPSLREKIHPRLPYTGAEVVWAARMEMARTVEDVLYRRTRALLLDAAASIECSTRVAGILAEELGRDSLWESRQVADFVELASSYTLQPVPTQN
jgi:glycerol-3-phosphate dehydrogenase